TPRHSCNSRSSRPIAATAPFGPPSFKRLPAAERRASNFPDGYTISSGKLALRTLPPPTSASGLIRVFRDRFASPSAVSAANGDPDERYSQLAHRRRLVRQLQLCGCLSVHLRPGTGQRLLRVGAVLACPRGLLRRPQARQSVLGAGRPVGGRSVGAQSN